MKERPILFSTAMVQALDAPEQWKPNGVVTTINERTMKGEFFELNIDPNIP